VKKRTIDKSYHRLGGLKKQMKEARENKILDYHAVELAEETKEQTEYRNRIMKSVKRTL